VGWNYFYAATMFGCSDIIAFAGLFQFWLPDLSPAVWISIALVVITLLNSYHVKFFGESEFYLASLKVLLMVGIILMTFVVMLGGNPDHDRIGFRYWKDPGVMAEYYTTGPFARFLGFFQVFKIAAFSIGGPDLVAMSSAEAVQPRKTIPRATKSIVVRMALFFVLGAICMGILVPYNDADLKEAVATGVGANASAFVVGMKRVHIRVLPHIFNAIVCTSALSCSNGFAYIATRLLHALASEGKAPKFFARTTKHGIPLFAYFAVLAIYCLAYLEVGTNSATVFGWFINLSSVGALINFAALAVLSLRFRAAIKKQGFDAEKLLPWYSRWTVPYTWFSLVFILIITLFQGWTVFVHGGWDLEEFFTSYFGLALVAVIFVAWKLYHKTKFVKLEDIDLTSRIAEFDSLDQYYEDHPIQSTTMWGRFLDKLF
jgi:amino acid transporter